MELTFRVRGADSCDCTENYMLENEEWKKDTVPEFWQGKNVADFIDPDIAEKLEALEREDEKLQAEGFYDSDDSFVRRFLQQQPGDC